jgi:cytochrome oxidase Cu insertion factor (SCO1/SenC/PrrC family)
VTSPTQGQPVVEKREGRGDGTTESPRSHQPRVRRGRTVWIAVGALGLAAALSFAVVRPSLHDTGQSSTPAEGSSAIEAGGGFPIRGRAAPSFTLADQFGRPVSLSSLRGHEVVLAFIDSRCTTVCPLTAAILRDALHRIGPAGSRRAALVAVNANPTAARVADVYRFSVEHGMLHQWVFLTGSPAKLEAVYKEYEVSVTVERGGGVVHDAAIIIIGPDGRERLYYETLDSNARVTVESEIRALLAGMRQWLSGGLTAAAGGKREQHGSNAQRHRALSSLD